MSIFSKKRGVFFIGEHFFEPGVVTVGREPFFEPGESSSYTKETLSILLRSLRERFPNLPFRAVLGEELVYVTELSFPPEAVITREVVRIRAEQSVPEVLRDTDWDFQALRYVKTGKRKGGMFVQVVVVKKGFSVLFREALGKAAFVLEGALSESCILAHAEARSEETIVVISRNRETTFFCAIQDGSVIATQSIVGPPNVEALRSFLSFLVTHKKRTVKKIYYSRCTEEEFLELSSAFPDRVEHTVKEYNPLVYMALEGSFSKKDEDVLNIDFSGLVSQKHWWWPF